MSFFMTTGGAYSQIKNRVPSWANRVSFWESQYRVTYWVSSKHVPYCKGIASIKKEIHWTRSSPGSTPARARWPASSKAPELPDSEREHWRSDHNRDRAALFHCFRGSSRSMNPESEPLNPELTRRVVP